MKPTIALFLMMIVRVGWGQTPPHQGSINGGGSCGEHIGCDSLPEHSLPKAGVDVDGGFLFIISPTHPPFTSAHDMYMAAVKDSVELAKTLNPSAATLPIDAYIAIWKFGGKIQSVSIANDGSIHLENMTMREALEAVVGMAIEDSNRIRRSISGPLVIENKPIRFINHTKRSSICTSHTHHPPTCEKGKVK